MIMSNYVESKKTIDSIRSNYSCAGDIIFRAAIQMVVECGQYTLLNDEWYNAEIEKLDKSKPWYHFEQGVYGCARLLAYVNSSYLLAYIQKEVWLGNDGTISYLRALELLKRCIDWFADDIESIMANLHLLGFKDNEIKTLGYDWLFEEEEA
jgi:hypothetical protein